jgi:radical SAM protein with 4Fe4S-binding SPASM domain
VPAGRGAALAAAVLTPVETAAFGQALRRAAHAGWPWQRRTRVSCDRALQFLAGDGAPYRCNAGADLLALLPTGDVLPCRRLPIVVGNVGQTPLADLYDEAELLRQLRDRERIPGRCVACAHARTCGGGLRCLAYAVTGDPWAADPGCWLARG